MKTKISPVKISLILIVLVAVWLLSGVFASEDEVEKENEVSLAKVQVEKIAASQRFQKINLKGESKALREVDMRVEVSGKVEEIIANDGDKLKEGAKIIRMDSRARYENLRSARAELEEKRTYYKAAQRLFEKKLQSEVGIAKARADYEMANSNVRNMQIEVDNITLKAPFDGVLQKIGVEVGEYVDAGKVIGKFIDYSSFKVVINVPEAHISQIRAGQKVEVKLANGSKFIGKVKFISAMANKNTRTFETDVLVENNSENFFDGMTAEVEVPLKETMAHKISPAYFSLNTAGEIGVKILDAGNKVKFVKVDILQDTDDGIWITGLEGDVTIITTGHEYVQDAQEVEPKS